ncbi:MAG: transcription antitermination factor NusB [Acidimicrobiales bacterium]
MSRPPAVVSPPGTGPRRVALDALERIEEGGRANPVLSEALSASRLTPRDRALVTELVYGATRMRRACDFLVDRFVLRRLDTPTRAALRLGAYQLHFLRTPAHAAVSVTVDLAPRRSRGLVNAVLRRVADAPVAWPDDATRLSYPDWIVDRLVADLGQADATAALDAMNQATPASERPDGYTQDRASQWVAAAVGAEERQRVADVCAAPGGKATALATTGAWVFASDIDPARVGLVSAAVTRTGAASVSVVVADARDPPWAPASFARVLVDAPCSGLGVLHRRPDARWRRQPDDIARLATLQRELLDAAAQLVRPGGTLVYSVCTITSEETLDIDRWLAATHSELEALAPPDPPWRPQGRGALLLPQAAGTDGMGLLRLARVRRD